MTRIITKILFLLLAANAFALPDDQYQPIEIQADKATHHEKDGLTIYKGNVMIRQGSLVVNAENVIVSNPKDSNETELITTGNPATFQQQPEKDKAVIHASAKKINYQVNISRIELMGEARLEQGESSIKSDKIVYNVDEQVFKAETLEDKSGTSQRVEIVIPSRKKAEDKPTDTKN